MKEQIRGTVVFLRSKESGTCACCKDSKEFGHVFSRFISTGYKETAVGFINKAVFSFKEGARVVITVSDEE